MKRSEFQQIVKDFLFEKVIGHFVDVGGEFGEMIYDHEAETFSKELMEKIKESGLVPPGDTQYNQHGSGDDYYCVAIDTYEWEPEDA